MSISLLLTSDNSHTIYNAELNETYHSRNGAIQESEHVFLNNGLLAVASKNTPLNILEIGFGTGLNALLTLIKSDLLNLACNYMALETFPLGADIIDELNYPNFFSPHYKACFKTMHQTKWNTPVELSANFRLTKLTKSVHAFTPTYNYDLIYFDAFGPDKQPDMWTIDVFKKMYTYLSKGGVLATYSAKGEVKRNLKQVGFEVELLPGPPGKRNMIRAIKI